MELKAPPYEELEPELKRFIQPENEKAMLMLAKGLAPLPPANLISSWAFLSLDPSSKFREPALQSLKSFPQKNLLALLPQTLPSWVLYFLGREFRQSDEVLELILLNENTPTEFFLEVAAQCSERLATIIANNQERIIEAPELVVTLEKNPHSLKSQTETLRQFLRLAGIFVPGEPTPTVEPVVEKKEESKTAEDPRAGLADEEVLSEEKRISLLRYIQTLMVGAKVKLALKGNKEARSILIRDTNKTVATAVLKSPRITENEIVL